MPDEPKLQFRFALDEKILDVNEARQVITTVMGGEDLCADGIALQCDGRRIWGGGDSVPMLWAHGMDIRGRLPTGSVRNIRTERIADALVNVGEKHYYQPGEAVKHLESDLVTMPSVIFDMKRQGHFKAVSEGFRIITAIDRDGGGITATAWWFCELSDCPVGMDPIALDRFIRERALNDAQRDWLIGRECQHCGRCHESAPQQEAIKPSMGLDTIALALQTAKPKEG